MATLRVLGIHGVGDHHSNTSWMGQWEQAIQRAVGTWDPSMKVQCTFPLYDQFFEDSRFKLNAGSYANALFKLSTSAVEVGVAAVEEKVGEVVSGVENFIGGLFHPSSRGLADVPIELRWTAGMVAQWADYDQLRKELRQWLADELGKQQYDLVLAHSLGTLVSYDTFVHDQRLLNDAMNYVVFGSQIANPFVRAMFGGYLMPLTRPRAWYQLFNPSDRVFTSRIRVPSDSKFMRIETPFKDGFISHTDVRYLLHENAVAGPWYKIVTGRNRSRAFKPIEEALRAFESSVTTVARDRGRRVKGKFPPNRRALLIGINEYPDAQNRLEGCINDVFLMSAALQESGFDPEDIRVVFDERATAQGILERMHWLLDGTQKNDERVLFYSGHGAQIPGYGANLEVDHFNECLVPYDFDWTEPHAVTDKQLAELYSQLPYGTLFTMIFDCCHSGGLSRDGGAKVRGVTPPDDVRHRALQWNSDLEMWEARKFDPITTDRKVLGKHRKQAYVGKGGAKFRLGRGVGLRQLPSPEKARRRLSLDHEGPFMPLILEACQEDELAYEYRHGVTSYGAFTFSLTKELRDVRHQPGSKRVTFARLLQMTTTRLHTLRNDQTPCIVGPGQLRDRTIPWRSTTTPGSKTG
jgi:hypothetical protein